MPNSCTLQLLAPSHSATEPFRLSNTVETLLQMVAHHTKPALAVLRRTHCLFYYLHFATLCA